MANTDLTTKIDKLLRCRRDFDCVRQELQNLVPEYQIPKMFQDSNDQHIFCKDCVTGCILMQVQYYTGENDLYT